ncbi:DiGeorge syndrome critical region gene 6 [Homo sapiens]|uniref:Isoform 2 of Protein DGCR6 n=1 Tax=Homo sapiens TaxID=9606 RepID=Q14129-2|nr:protein DGCR6 isoform X1 [Homo sapiens]XP_054181927.1 protein DGCR6 isoform X1 [Homo sapiens]AHW56642.1 DiGeorge syndrome critical region 6 isoform C [Homo sapiens]KAI2596627.1 DiGeorge syndrome critical region protein 6 [Homo sapiens]KAI4001815.1 DiGeorge syndrome critical region gene 6 [Homo sapiens]
MERYAGALEEVADGARQQERHYQLLSALQSLVKELPSSFQQRLSYTTLSDLALALLDGTVFEIVQGLLEIQHLTEKSLYNQRLRLQNEHRVPRTFWNPLETCRDSGVGGWRRLASSPVQTPLWPGCSAGLCSGRRCGRSTRKPSRPAGPITCLCFRRLSSEN